MTENPPPPADETPSPPKPDFDPRRPMFQSAQSPREPAGCGAIIGRVLLGSVSFVISIVVFVMIMAALEPATGASAGGALMIGIDVALVAILFAIRKRTGPSPLLGAVVVGATVALVVFGGCMLILMNGKMDFK
jgi:hypothetical protein